MSFQYAAAPKMPFITGTKKQILSQNTTLKAAVGFSTTTKQLTPSLMEPNQSTANLSMAINYGLAEGFDLQTKPLKRLNAQAEFSTITY